MSASSPSGAVPPAGWYPDPQTNGQQRYWDGIQWTQHVAPQAVAAQPQYTQYAAQPAQQQQFYNAGYQQMPVAHNKDDDATAASWIIGILASILIPIVGLILGIYWATRNGTKRNAGIACIAISIAMTVIWIALRGSGSN